MKDFVMRISNSRIFNNSLFSATPKSSLFGPFNSTTQRRWKKPENTAQTRLESRTRDLKLDKLTSRVNKLGTALALCELISTRKRGPFVSLQLLSRWRNILGLNITTTDFIRKYPHIFEVFTQPITRNLCCRVRKGMKELIQEEENVIRASEFDHVIRIKKILMMSTNGTIHLHALRLVKRELGLPEDFRESVIGKHSDEFRLVDIETVALVDRDVDLGVAEVEKWREKEFRDKWLSEFETKYAFPINFPTGFKIEAGCRDRLKNWQRMPYVKPYEMQRIRKGGTRGGVERFEKRAVGILHEFLCLTVERMVEVERLAHFKKDFGIEDVRELILKHPGIFYISTQGKKQTLFLREAYSSGCLIQPNQISAVRQKMLHLISMGRRHTRELITTKEFKRERYTVAESENDCETKDGDWAIPFVDSLNDQNNSTALDDFRDCDE